MFDTSATGFARGCRISQGARRASAAGDRRRGPALEHRLQSARARADGSLRRSRPLLQIHGPLTAGLSSGVMRSMATFCRVRALSDAATRGLRCQILDAAAARAAGQTDGVGCRNQTRALVQEVPRQQRARPGRGRSRCRSTGRRKRPVPPGGCSRRRRAALDDAQRHRLRDLVREAHAAHCTGCSARCRAVMRVRQVVAAWSLMHLRLERERGCAVVLGSGSPAACTRRPCRRCRSRPGGSA